MNTRSGNKKMEENVENLDNMKKNEDISQEQVIETQQNMENRQEKQGQDEAIQMLIGMMIEAKRTRQEDKEEAKEKEKLQEERYIKDKEEAKKLRQEENEKLEEFKKEIRNILRGEEAKQANILDERIQTVRGEIKEVEEKQQEIREEFNQRFEENKKNLELETKRNAIEFKQELIRIDNENADITKSVMKNEEAIYRLSITVNKELEKNVKKINLEMTNKNLELKRLIEEKNQNAMNGSYIEWKRDKQIMWNGGLEFGEDGKINPNVFIKNLERNIKRIQDVDMLKTIIRTTMKEGSIVWYQGIEDRFESFEEFKNMFLEKYWGEIEQNKVRELINTEEKERELHAAHGRGEIALQTVQRDYRYTEEKVKDLEKKLRTLEIELNSEEQKKEAARNAFQDLVRRLSVALGGDIAEAHLSTEALVHKASELVQETSRLRNRANNIQDTLATSELDVRTLRDSLDRSAQILEIDRLRQEKESIEMQCRVAERENIDFRDKLSSTTRNLGSASSNIAQLEATVCQLRDDLKLQEERHQHLHQEHRSFLESTALLLSTPTRFIDSLDEAIKDRIRDILADNREKSAHIEELKEKLAIEIQQLNRQISLYEQANAKIKILEDDKALLEHKIYKTDTELKTSEISRDGLKRDKNTVIFKLLERLARALNMDEISSEAGVDLHTESLLLRAEQLSRLENEKLVDKTAVVYQLQRRVRTLREQLQRKDLHLDLLRRKLALQEDSTKAKFLLQGERDEANLRIKKLNKQIDRLHLQLSDAKDQIRDLNAQLAEAADYKITALERGRKVEDLQKRLIESEALRTKCNRKVLLLKDQVRVTGQTVDQERHISEHSLQLLRDELARVKDNLSEISRRESQLQSFKSSVAKILGVILPMPDFELVSRLQKLVDAHHEFTVVSRRYDDPVLRLTSRSPTLGSSALLFFGFFIHIFHIGVSYLFE
ncbi:hypothetical protein RN001_003135 [Aquatica leii]|uniref:Uncharacterized protein n=1 Tax=Aquatica leii TaxID=1421715 RepID=A0AAN7Q5Z1_9COLE|nr:hypothetical protein RN001_003135 [Aquatica leii]